MVDKIDSSKEDEKYFAGKINKAKAIKEETLKLYPKGISPKIIENASIYLGFLYIIFMIPISLSIMKTIG
ncbi:hypothetical protein NLC29_00060 [Candidatus Aminicenantes bacterium AH-873-B07]|nr:hypothetical protein [Candidatus Aminicenantes bacterium AH-873-B07]